MARGLVTKGIKIKADTKGTLPSEIELLHTGSWNAPFHGEWETTPEDLKQYVANFEAGVGLVQGGKGAHINFDHVEGKAAGWIKSLSTSEDGNRLIGQVEWTDTGRKALLAGEYCYISPEFNPRAYHWEDPEQEYHFVANVLTAAALTNAPLHKKLKPVMASAAPPKKPDAGSSGNNDKEGDEMKLEDVRVKKLEDLTDDEKAFLVEHKDELTEEERTTFEIPADKTDDEEELDEEGKPIVKASQHGTVSISAAELATLRASAKAGEEANARLDRKEAEEFVSARIKAGQVKSGEKKNTVNMILASKGEARKNLMSFMEGLPANERVNATAHGDAGGEAKSAQDELIEKAQEAVKASSGKVSMDVALKDLLATDKDLADRVTKERKTN